MKEEIKNAVPKTLRGKAPAAYKWMLLAAAQGDQLAAKNVAGYERMMTREQIAEGQSLARNFKPRKALLAGSDRTRQAKEH